MSGRDSSFVAEATAVTILASTGVTELATRLLSAARSVGVVGELASITIAAGTSGLELTACLVVVATGRAEAATTSTGSSVGVVGITAVVTVLARTVLSELEARTALVVATTSTATATYALEITTASSARIVREAAVRTKAARTSVSRNATAYISAPCSCGHMIKLSTTKALAKRHYVQV